MPVRVRVSIVAGLLLSSWLAASGQSTDLVVIDRIKREAFERSEVMEHLRYLTDVHGPRLTGSPQFAKAAEWAIGRLKEYGLANVHLDRWGPFGRSWSVDGYTVEQVEPRYARLHAVPLAWSAPTNGVIVAEPLLTPLETSFMRGPKKLRAALDEYRNAWTGKLRGRLLLLTTPKPISNRTNPLFTRYTESRLQELFTAPEPAKPPVVKSIEEIDWPDDPADLFQLFDRLPDDLTEQFFDRYAALEAERGAFLANEGVAAVLVADNRARDGLLAAEAAGSFRSRDPLAPATFVVTAEDYDRIARLLQHKQPVRLRVDLKVSVSSADVDGTNIIAELPGGSKHDKVVMIGAHFDSWHSGTGATDNGVGSAVMIDVMRILKALNLKLDRTVRLALWGGEEQGLLGSRAYVKREFADPQTMQVTPQHAKLSGYFNLDNGSGRIRGVYLQGHEAMRPLFEQWFAPFRDLGVTTVTIRSTSGTDHQSFTRVGLPGFQFIQDGLDYFAVTHHTNVDTYEHAVPGDLMQASAVIASVVYHAANHPERLPRRPLPAAAGAQ